MSRQQRTLLLRVACAFEYRRRFSLVNLLKTRMHSDASSASTEQQINSTEVGDNSAPAPATHEQSPVSYFPRLASYKLTAAQFSQCRKTRDTRHKPTLLGHWSPSSLSFMSTFIITRRRVVYSSSCLLVSTYILLYFPYVNILCQHSCIIHILYFIIHSVL